MKNSSSKVTRLFPKLINKINLLINLHIYLKKIKLAKTYNNHSIYLAQMIKK